MSTTTFFAQTLNWTGGKEISSGMFPEYIDIPTLIWSHVREMRKYSDSGSDRMLNAKGYTGSLGYEYSSTVAYIIDDIYISNITGGNWTSVKSSISIEVKYDEPDYTKQQVRQRRFLNKKEVGNKTYNFNNLPDPKKVAIGAILTMHTHPKQKINEQSEIAYGFYSIQDVQNLLNSNLWLSGLITKHIWLLGKTSKASLPEAEQLHRLGFLEKDNYQELINKARIFLGSKGYVLYFAENFGERLKRVF